MKKIFLILSILISGFTFSQVKIGLDGGMHSTGAYPTTYSNENFGGLWSVKTIAQRNAIPSNFRDTGMLVYVKDELKYYSLKNGKSNSDWVELSLNGKVIAAYGLINVNDSTLKADTLYIPSLERLMKVADSLGVIIAAKPSFGDVRDIVHDTANVLVRIADSASMLTPYLRKVDTAEFVKKTRTLTIGKNGSATDLSDDRVFLDSVPNINTTNATNITSGTLSDARLSSNVPKMVSNVLPAVDGSLLTNLNPASIATVIQTITATATINNSTTTLLVNPATVVSSLSITFCAAPYQTQIIRIVFGGTITSGNQVVTTLSILPNSGQSVVRKFPSVEAFAGDFLAFQYINTNWYQIN